MARWKNHRTAHPHFSMALLIMPIAMQTTAIYCIRQPQAPRRITTQVVQVWCTISFKTTMPGKNKKIVGRYRPGITSSQLSRCKVKTIPRWTYSHLRVPVKITFLTTGPTQPVCSLIRVPWRKSSSSQWIRIRTWTTRLGWASGHARRNIRLSSRTLRMMATRRACWVARTAGRVGARSNRRRYHLWRPRCTKRRWGWQWVRARGRRRRSTTWATLTLRCP